MRTEADQSLAGLTRRRLLRNAGVFAIAGSATGLIAACGSEDDSSSQSSGGPSGNSPLPELLGTPSGKAAGAGLTVALGGANALSGPAATAYGQDFLRGIKLAVKHIEQAGGPRLDFQPRDNGGGDTSKTPGYMRELGAAQVPVLLTSFSANSVSEIPFYEQYKMLALDGGAAASAALAPEPWYYVMTTVTGLQTPGIIEYIKRTTPEATRVSSLLQDLGEDVLEGYRRFVTGAVEAGGLENSGEVLFSDYAQTDFSSQLAELRSQKPQAVLVTMFGAQMGTFMKQFAASGIDADIYGYDWTPDTGKAGGKAMADYRFTGVYFDPRVPTSDWDSYYIEQYTKEYGSPPTTYSTIYYENTFHVWQLIMQIIESGGDPTVPGDHWLQALEDHPSFFAVRGDKGSSEPGTVEMDLKSHVFKKQLNVMAVAGVLPKRPDIVATFDIDGSDFQEV